MSKENPFASPLAALRDQAAGPVVVAPAKKSKRVMNYILDGLIAGLVISVVLTICLIASLLIWGAQAEEFWLSLRNPLSARTLLFNYVFGGSVALCYYTLFELKFGRTPAKWLTGTEVVSAEGSSATTKQILWRSFWRLLPIEVFTFLGKTGRGLHDRLTGTYVVESPKAQL